MEDAYRRAQLLGKVDSSISFMARPFFPTESLKLNERIDSDSSMVIGKKGKLGLRGKWGEIKLLPITWQVQNNTDHPYSMNDGAMIPARGYQTLISGGFFARFGRLSLQILPEYDYAKNEDFQGFYKQHSDQRWYEYYQTVVFIDMPEKFGDKPYKKLSWGQSSLRFKLGALSVGLSNENLWWGPGMRNSLVMSNSAAGFVHYTLNTVKPIRTAIGSFEGQIIGGRLENSGFDVPDTARTFLGWSIWLKKRDEWRYINAMVLSYQPKWVPGLFLGLTRSFTKYNTEKDNSFRELLPVFFSMTRKNNYDNPSRLAAGDQRVSAFARWLWLPENAEIYFEYMREDNTYNWRDFILQLEYSRSYLFGVRKMIPLNRHKGQYIQVNLELTQLEQTNANPNAPSRYDYTSRVVLQGYTHYGQLLGSGIGPGSNLQSLSVSWVNGFKNFGLQVERYVHNNDYHNIGIKDIRANWVDMSVTAFGEWRFQNMLYSVKMARVTSYNYQHLFIPKDPNSTNFFKPGINIQNYQAQIGISYVF
jgi:hypothetical protein